MRFGNHSIKHHHALWFVILFWLSGISADEEAASLARTLSAACSHDGAVHVERHPDERADGLSHFVATFTQNQGAPEGNGAWGGASLPNDAAPDHLPEDTSTQGAPLHQPGTNAPWETAQQRASHHVLTRGNSLTGVPGATTHYEQAQLAATQQRWALLGSENITYNAGSSSPFPSMSYSSIGAEMQAESMLRDALAQLSDEPLPKRGTKMDVPWQLYEANDQPKYRKHWYSIARDFQEPPRRDSVKPTANMLERLCDPVFVDYFERAGTFQDECLLQDLSFVFDEQSRSASNPQSQLFANMLRDRARAFRRAANAPRAIIREKVTLPQEIVQLCPELGTIAITCGNRAQFRLHREIMYLLNEGSNLLKTYGRDNNLFFSMTLGMWHMLALARQEHNPEAAFKLVDAAHHLITAARFLAKGATICGKGLALGGANFVEHNVAFLQNLIYHPLDTGTAASAGLISLASSLIGGYLKLKLGELRGDYEFHEELLDYAVNYFNQAAGDPAAAVAFLTETALNFGIGAKLGGAVANCSGVQNAMRLVRQQEAFLTAAQQFQHIKHTAHAALFGNPIGAAAVAAVKEAGREYASLLAEARDRFKDKMPKLNLKHLIYGEKSRDKMTKAEKAVGLHTTHNMPSRIIEKFPNTTKFGTYDGIIEVNGLRKESSFFPDNWNLAKIYGKINEAWHNPIAGTETRNGFIGLTNEGLPIQIYLRKIPGTSDIVINSAFPAHTSFQKLGII